MKMCKDRVSVIQRARSDIYSCPSLSIDGRLIGSNLHQSTHNIYVTILSRVV